MTALTQDTIVRTVPPSDGLRSVGVAAGQDMSPLDLLVSLCRNALVGGVVRSCRHLAGQNFRSDFIALVDGVRLWSACEVGYGRAGAALPEAIAANARAARMRAMLANSRVMSLARIACPGLAIRDIPVLAFKGPFQQRQLHGDWFVRRSNDLDLLVARGRFDEALAVLEAIGFRRRADTSPWWKLSLGEVHLDAAGGGVIDLHHQLQQPGCPAPRDLPQFIAASQIERVGDVDIAIPSFQHGLLILALNFCKELFHRKVSARYAFDFATGALRLSPDTHDAFSALVQRQGLEGPVGFTLAACESLFGPLPGLSALATRRSPLPPWAGHSNLARLVFTPDADGVDWPRRRAVLWQFCGGEKDARSLLDFAAQVGRIAVGEGLRTIGPESFEKGAS